MAGQRMRRFFKKPFTSFPPRNWRYVLHRLTCSQQSCGVLLAIDFSLEVSTAYALTMTTKQSPTSVLSPTAPSFRSGILNRRDAMLGAVAALAGVPGAQAALGDRVIVVDGWVIKQTDLRAL